MNKRKQIKEASSINKIFSNWNKKNAPGCAMGIIKDGEIIYSSEYGMSDLEHNLEINNSSVFYIASISKQFTAFCILLLEEKGKLKLDDEIQKYLPNFPKYKTPITIEHLIYHTSGIKNYAEIFSDEGINYLDGINSDAVYELIKKQKKLDFKPGSSYLYNNSGYFLLGLIIEKITGKPLSIFADDNIFKPLKMKNTFYCDDNATLIKNRAFSYEKVRTNFKNMVMRNILVGAGGIYSCINDLFLWDQNFYNNKLGKGTQEIIEKIQTKGALINGRRYGSVYGSYASGLVIGSYKGFKIISHGGVFAGYRAELIRFPEQNFSIVILCNRSDAMPTKLSLKVADIFLKHSSK